MTCDGIDCILFTAENCIKKKQLEKELGSLPGSGTAVMHHRNSKSIPYLHYYVDGKTLSKRIHEAGCRTWCLVQGVVYSSLQIL